MARKVSKNTKRVSKVSTETNNKSYLERLENEVQTNQSKVSLVLGALIVLVVGILVFNYFNRGNSNLGPAQQTEEEQQEGQDVSPNNLPGKYTIKEGDTLFTIAEKYYQDGYKYTEIAKANNLTDVNQLEVGQVITIPKLELEAGSSPEASATAVTSATPTATPATNTSDDKPQATQQLQGEKGESLGTGGGNTTIWGI